MPSFHPFQVSKLRKKATKAHWCTEYEEHGRKAKTTSTPASEEKSDTVKENWTHVFLLFLFL